VTVVESQQKHLKREKELFIAVKGKESELRQTINMDKEKASQAHDATKREGIT